MARRVAVGSLFAALAIQLLLLVLKLAGALAWTWLLVFAPLLAVWAAGIGLGLAAVAGVLVARQAAARAPRLAPAKA
jgi:ABC-type antimicrobial peptide transport system permease subunit